MNNIEQLKQELDNLWETKKSFAALKRYLVSQNIPYIASGSSRWVFGPIDGHVLKIARNKRGLAQNNAEADWVLDKYDVICHWFDASKNNIWIESEYCTKAKVKDFEKILGYGFGFYKNCLQCLKDELYDRCYRQARPAGYDELINNEDDFFYSIYCLCTDFDMGIDDLCRLSSYGINSQGKIVIVDYGLNNSIWKEYYSK